MCIYINLSTIQLFIQSKKKRPLSENMAKIIVLCCLIILAAFGSVHGSSKKQEVGFYELKKGDISMKFTNWGAAIVSLILPDKHGMFFL